VLSIIVAKGSLQTIGGAAILPSNIQAVLDRLSTAAHDADLNQTFLLTLGQHPQDLKAHRMITLEAQGQTRRHLQAQIPAGIMAQAHLQALI